jgi:cytochrome P450
MTQRLHLLTPEIRANPFPTYAELRRNAPVSQVDPGGMWAVSRYEDIMQVLKNPQRFTSSGMQLAWRPKWCPDYPLADSMLVTDPPRHGRLRAIMTRAFSVTAMSRLEPRIRQLAEDTAAAIPLGRSVDFVEAYNLVIPAGVMGLLLNMPKELYPRIKHWSDHLGQFTGVKADDLEMQRKVSAVVEEVRHHFTELIQVRRREPGEDLLSNLLAAEVEGESLSEKEILSFMFLLLVGGLESSVHLLGHSLMALRDDPELTARLRANPALLPAFVDEMLRFQPSVHGLMRQAVEETELGGVRVPAGARLLLLVASGCRDEAQFPNADRIDLERGQVNLPFGYGIHFCLGAFLARLEARLALETLLARFARFTPGDAPVKWGVSLVVRGPLELPLVAHPA